MAKKNCFMNQERPCDLTCKAAFEVDDPMDNVDCYFVWLSYHFGESLFEIKRVLEGFGGGGGGGFSGGPPGGTFGGGPGGTPGGGPGPKDFPGFPKN